MILNLKLEVGVTNRALLQQVVQDLHTQGVASNTSLTDLGGAACEVINANIPLNDAGLELIHWESETEDE